VFLTIGGGSAGCSPSRSSGRSGGVSHAVDDNRDEARDAQGTTMGVAAAAAFALAPLAVLTVGLKIRATSTTRGGARDPANEFVKTVSDKDLANSIAGVQKQLDAWSQTPYDSKNKVIDVLNVLIAESNKRATAAGAAVASGSAPARARRGRRRYEPGPQAVRRRRQTAAPRMNADGVDAAIAFGKGVATAAGDVVSRATRSLTPLQKPLDLAKVKTMLAARSTRRPSSTG